MFDCFQPFSGSSTAQSELSLNAGLSADSKTKQNRVLPVRRSSLQSPKNTFLAKVEKRRRTSHSKIRPEDILQVLSEHQHKRKLQDLNIEEAGNYKRIDWVTSRDDCSLLTYDTAFIDTPSQQDDTQQDKPFKLPFNNNNREHHSLQIAGEENSRLPPVSVAHQYQREKETGKKLAEKTITFKDLPGIRIGPPSNTSSDDEISV